MLLADGMVQQWGDIGAIGVVIAMALVGMKSGLFVATLWGLSALIAVMAGLSGLDRLGTWLLSANVPPVWIPAASYTTIAVAVALALRLAVGAVVMEDEVRFPPLIDTLGGLAVGALAGVIAAGGLQLALSMAPLPAWAGRVDPRKQLDFGGPLLECFARFATADPLERKVVLEGEPGLKFDPAAALKPPASPQEELERKLNPWKYSEVFADMNLNGDRDEDEPFADSDGDGKFSLMTETDDRNGNRLRDIGLLERYRLGPWLTVSMTKKLPPQRDGEGGGDRPAATLTGEPSSGAPSAPPTQVAAVPPAPPITAAPSTAQPSTAPPAVKPPAPPVAPPSAAADKVVIRVTAATLFDAEAATAKLSKKLDVVGSTWTREGNVTIIVLPYGGKLKEVIAAIADADVGLVAQTDAATRTISVAVE